ncbi:MAG TPA: FtsX-like permease family protein [Acidimicrobiales bacterium]|nr:FtsX-like permease family protein [Acidimicrobiales bacterium]
MAVLVGVGGGLAMGSLAAARRTDTAYPRFLEQARPPDLVLDPDFEADSAGFLDAVEELPAVADRSDAQAVAMARVVEGQLQLDDFGTTIASVDGERFYERDRVHVVEGRMPDPERVDEVLVSHTVAAEGLAVGDHLTYGVLDVQEAFGALEQGRSEFTEDDAVRVVEVEVTGIGIFPELAVTEEVLAPDVVLITPALFRELPAEAALWTRAGIHLEPGADAGAVQRQIKDLAAASGGDTFFEDRADITDRAQRSLRPYVLALTGLGVAGAVFVTLLATQLVRRTVAQADADRRVLVALSAGPRLVRAGAALPAAVAAVLAVGVALAVQAGVSAGTPVGPVESIEPSPGVHLDWVVAATGAVLLLAVCLLPALAVTQRSQPARVPAGALTTWATHAGAPLPLLLGIGRATGLGDRWRRRAARSGLAAVALAATMLVAVATFAASLAHLVDHPEVHGWNADVGLLGAGGYGSFDLEAAAEVEGVESITGGVFANVGIEDTTVPGVGLVPLRGGLLPPVLEGRAPQAPGEIALGQASLAEIGARVGDVVDVRTPGDEPTAMTIVGTTVLPGLGPIDNDRPALGNGAFIVFPPDSIGEATWSLILADLAPGADRRTVVDDLVLAADEQAGETDVFDVFRPADIDAFADVGAVPLALVGLFGLVALGSLVHVLFVTAVAWRRDRAVLAALGATPRQLRESVRWQSVVVVALALVAALPAGSVLGRRAWQSLATEVGVVPDTVVPTTFLAALVVALLLVALALTAVPERRAAGQRPVDHLRAD